MTKEKIETAKQEAKCFLKRVYEYEKAQGDDREYYTYSVRRASMDLTRALAELRKPE
jgi:hypothetical protein